MSPVRTLSGAPLPPYFWMEVVCFLWFAEGVARQKFDFIGLIRRNLIPKELGRIAASFCNLVGESHEWIVRFGGVIIGNNQQPK